MAAPSASFDRAAEATASAFGRTMKRLRRHFTMYPYRTLASMGLVVGAIWYYEVKYVHDNRVYSPAHSQEYEMASTPEERDARRRVRAQRVPTPQELAAAAKENGAESIADRVARLERHKKEGKQPKEDDVNTLFVTNGHLQTKEGTWGLRNTERNWSILAQDQFKQKDDYYYRLERSKDDDYGRLSAKKA